MGRCRSLGRAYRPVGAMGLAVLAVTVLAACSDSVREVTPRVQVVEQPAKPADPHATVGQRFGMRTAAMNTAPAQTSYTWTVPEGWQEIEPTPTRQANLRVGPSGEAECYLSVLPGTAGGVEENLNRWRAQMSQSPYSDAELAELERLPVLDQDGVLAYIEGTWRGMDGGSNESGYALAGMVVPDGPSTLFVKMVGPVEVVQGEMDALRTFCQSIRRAERAEPASPHGTGQPRLTWTAPEGWVQSPDQPMRDVTFRMGPDNATECYVAVLQGEAGGVAANINRWLAQLGREPLDAAALADLPQIEILGQSSVMVASTGTFTGMSGEPQPDYGLIGAVCPLPDRTLFVKMTGPQDEVEAQREAFVAFCESLRLEGSGQ